MFDPFTGVVLEGDEGVRLAETLDEKKAIILRNHGLPTVGPTVEAAAWWFITVDNASHAQLLAEAAGKPKLIAPEIARLTASQDGARTGGFFLLPAALGVDRRGRAGSVGLKRLSRISTLSTVVFNNDSFVP